MSWDDDLDAGGQIVLFSSYDPVPKPPFLLARDNLMIGWGGAYPELSLAFPGCGTTQLAGVFVPFIPPLEDRPTG